MLLKVIDYAKANGIDLFDDTLSSVKTLNHANNLYSDSWVTTSLGHKIHACKTIVIFVAAFRLNLTQEMIIS